MKQNQNARRNKPGRMNNQNNRNKGSRGRQQNGRGQQPTSMNKQVDSHGPAGKQRGTANQLYEKYKTLSRDAFSSDRQLSESLAQYADHYYRIFAEFAVAEAATQLVREKEKVRKTQEEAERRANSSPVQNTEPSEDSEIAVQTPVEVQAPDEEEVSLPAFLENVIPQTKPVEEKTLTLDLEPEKKAKEDKPAPKRRGRPRKVVAKDDAAQDK